MWSSCSVSCGIGKQTRKRIKITRGPKLFKEQRDCDIGPCGVPEISQIQECEIGEGCRIVKGNVTQEI